MHGTEQQQPRFGTKGNVLRYFQRVDWLLVAIVLLGVAVRLYCARNWNLHSPETWSSLRGDEPGYANTARELLQGLGFTWLGRVPGYPAVLAFLFWLTGESLHKTRLLQCLLGIPLLLLTFHLARRLIPLRAAYLTTFASAFILPLRTQPLYMMSEVLFTPVLVLVAIVTVRAFETPTLRRFAWLGFVIGLSDLIRPTLLLYPVAIGVAVFLVMPRGPAFRNATCCAVVAVITIFPWMLHNRIRHHALILATSNAFLWQGSPEYYHLIHDQGYSYLRIWVEVILGKSTPDPMSISGDRYWTRRALSSIRREPLIYVGYALEKVVTYWAGDRAADWNDRPLFRYHSLVGFGFTPSMAVEVIVDRLLPFVAVVGIIVLWPLRRRFFPLYVLLAFTTAFHAATHAESRLSEPFLPFVLILITGAMWRVGAILPRFSADPGRSILHNR